MRKALLLGVFLAVISTSIVVAAILGAKYGHPGRSTSDEESKNPAVGTSNQAYAFGTYPQRLKDGWNRKQYSSIVIFGASDCDNAHPRTKIYADTLRGAPYFEGRYTNGHVFGEYLAASTLTGHTLPLLDYAYGHATISNDLVNVMAPDTKMQMQMYIDDIINGTAQRGDEHGGRILHCIWIGKNDIIEIWNNVISNGTFQNGNANGEKTGFEFALKRVHEETNELLNQIKNIISNSNVNSIKSDFLLMLLPPLEIVPNLYYQSKLLAKNDMTLSTMYLKYIGELTRLFNEDLSKGVNSLVQGGHEPSDVQSFSKHNLIFMDIPRYWYDIRNNPDQYNFINVVDACWNSTTGINCKEPERWQYYDTLHVTTKMHEYLAQEITVQVNL